MGQIKHKKSKDSKIALISCFVIVSLLTLLSRLTLHSIFCQPDKQSIDITNDVPVHPAHRFDPEQDDCKTINIASVVCGYNSTRSYYALLKSILFYRSDRVHLHIFSDEIAQTILKTLFKTWNVTDLDYSFYNITEYEQDVAWITSTHYSHRYGLIKLKIIDALVASTKSIDRAIVIDTDMLVLGNIARVWTEFDGSQDSLSPRSIGLVENQSDWYLRMDSNMSRAHRVWPAIGRGFNTGLIVLDLKQMRQLNATTGWSDMWKRAAESQLASELYTSLADQDIMNAIARVHSELVLKLPCNLNLQLHDHSKVDKLCPSQRAADLRIVHWNSPNKLQTSNPLARFYKNWQQTFVNWDGNLLRQSNCDASASNRIAANARHVEQSQSANDYLCADVRPSANETLRTYVYYVDFEYDPSEHDVTLVVHLSIDRLQVLHTLASHWPGPISAAIYLSEHDCSAFLESLRMSETLSSRKNIGYHLVFRDHGLNYPINRLRNIALDNSITPYVFLSDVDFLPAHNLYEYLKQYIASASASVANGVVIDESRHGVDGHDEFLRRQALVVPVFESSQYKFEFPAGKTELLQQISLGQVTMFREQLWPRGQAPTDYARWRTATRPYDVVWQLDYEPFIVTSRKHAPRFDERFVGFGWNKVEHAMRLAALGYEITVLPEAFAVHNFHSASFDIMKHRQSARYRGCINHLKREFVKQLASEHPAFFERLRATTHSAQ